MTFLEFCFRRYLGPPSGKYFTCPKCQHQTPSVVINEPVGNRQIKWRCHRCFAPRQCADEYDLLRLYHPKLKFPQLQVIVARLRDEWEAEGSGCSTPPALSFHGDGQGEIAQTEWQTRAEEFARDLSPELINALARELNLPTKRVLRNFLCWAIPHRTGITRCRNATVAGRSSGSLLRMAGVARKSCSSGREARIDALPTGWHDRAGPVSAAEGASCTLAMTAAGLSCVGRASAAWRTPISSSSFSRIYPPPERSSSLGENDEKPNGLWPGRTGATAVAGER